MDSLSLEEISRLTVNRIKRELNGLNKTFPSTAKKPELAKLLYDTLQEGSILKKVVMTRNGQDIGILQRDVDTLSDILLILDFNQIFWQPTSPKDVCNYSLTTVGSELCPGIGKKIKEKHNRNFKICVVGNGKDVDIEVIQKRARVLCDLNYDISIYIDSSLKHNEPLDVGFVGHAMAAIVSSPEAAVEPLLDESLCVGEPGFAKSFKIKNVVTPAKFIKNEESINATADVLPTTDLLKESTLSEHVDLKTIVPVKGNVNVMPYGQLSEEQKTAHVVVRSDISVDKKIEEPKEQPKPITKEQPKPITKEQPKPITKEQPKPITKEQSNPGIRQPLTIILRPPQNIGLTKDDRAKLSKEHDLTIEFHKVEPKDVPVVKFPVERRCTKMQISRYFKTLEVPTQEEATSSNFKLVSV